MVILEGQKLQDAILELQKMAKDNKEIEESGLDLNEKILCAFIHGKHGNVNKGFQTLKNYVSARKGKYKDFFKSVLPSRLTYFKDPSHRAIFYLKNRDNDGGVVGLFKLSWINFDEVGIEDIFRVLVLVCEEMMFIEEIIKLGLIMIVDCREIGFNHIKHFTPSRIQFLFNIFIGSYPIQFKAFHVLSDSYVIKPLWAAFKMFAPKKIRERIHMHGNDLVGLAKIIPSSILPVWVGGELSDEDCFCFKMEADIFSKEAYYKQMAMKW